jgi:hypothetical protein
MFFGGDCVIAVVTQLKLETSQMKTERVCPDCSNSFCAVADYCICPSCGRRFYASDPNRSLNFRMPTQLTINATLAGSHEDNGILNICFDDEQGAYVQLTRVSDDFVEEYDDDGGVYIEVNSQIVACSDGYSKIDLRPNKLSIQFRDETVMNGLLFLVVTFQIGDAFMELARQFGTLMRKKPVFSLTLNSTEDAG